VPSLNPDWTDARETRRRRRGAFLNVIARIRDARRRVPRRRLPRARTSKPESWGRRAKHPTHEPDHGRDHPPWPSPRPKLPPIQDSSS